MKDVNGNDVFSEEEIKKEKQSMKLLAITFAIMCFILIIYGLMISRKFIDTDAELNEIEGMVWAIYGIMTLFCAVMIVDSRVTRIKNAYSKAMIERLDDLNERVKKLEEAWAECNEESEYIERVKKSDECEQE